MKRWKKGMAWLLSVLCILVTVQIPSIPVKAEANGVQKKIEEILQKYPTGSFFSKDGNGCIHRYDETCSNCQLSSIDYDAFVANAATGDRWTCKAFGTSVFYRIFGVALRDNRNGDPRDINSGSGLIEQARIGDYIACFTGSNCTGKEAHAGIYLGAGNGTFKLYESNYPNTPNRVSYGEYDHSVSDWASYRIFHAYNYDEINNTSTTPTEPTVTQVSFVVPGSTGKYNISSTNAVLDANITTNVRTTSGITVGIKIGTSENNLGSVKNYSEQLSKAGYNQLNSKGYYQVWFDMNSELKITLKPNTTYYYQFYTLINNKDYTSGVHSFKTQYDNDTDTEKPTISNLKVVSKNRNGYTLQCNVSDNVGVAGVEFATCTEASGKTDWKTYTVTNIVNGVATCEIKTSDFADREGKYYTDVYAYDAAGNKTDWAQENTYYPYIDRTAPVVVSAEITSYDKDGYYVTATATDNVGVTEIKFPSWSSGSSEEDIVWYDGSPVVNGTSTCRINVKDMKPGNGAFTTDIRAYDADGNVSGITSINRLSIRIDSESPVISDVTTTKLSDTSYKVSCKVTDDHLQSVQFGTSVNGKLPAWKNVSATDGVYEVVISMDDFSWEEGDYLTTIKAADTFGNESAMVAELVSLTAKKPLTGITLDKTKLELEKGTTETLTISYDPVDTTDSKETLWSCSDYSVATVEDGVVTAVGKGNAIITARCGRYTATCNITVTEKNVDPDPEPTEKPLTGITLNKETLELEKGATESLTVRYTPEDTTDNKGVIWTSSEETVATVTDGTITAVGKGTAIITAKVGNYEASCTVKVTEKEVTPSPVPTETPTPSPTDKPSPTPSEEPSPTPSEDPSPTPSEDPSPAPSEDPSPTPSEDPSPTPSEDPSPTPSEDPSPAPSEDPSPTPSVSPDPVPTDKPKPVVKPNVPASGPASQHTHNFSWVTVQKASTTQDGLEELKCTCGMVKESSVIPASQAYVNELYQNLGKASENGEVSFDSGRIYTISDYLLKKLQERSDVTTTITFEYNRKKYRMIIPAGVDYTELLEDEDYFYGYFYFAKKVGAKIEEL